MDTKKSNSSLTSLNYGLKDWGILISTVDDKLIGRN